MLALHVVALAVDLEPALLVDGGVGADAEEDIVGFGFLGESVVAVVGGDDGDAELAADIGDGRIEPGELGVAMVLDFEVVVAVEDFAVIAGGRDGAVAVAFLDAAMELRGGATAEDGDAGRVLFDEFAVDAGLVVVALEVGLGDEEMRFL